MRGGCDQVAAASARTARQDAGNDWNVRAEQQGVSGVPARAASGSTPAGSGVGTRWGMGQAAALSADSHDHCTVTACRQLGAWSGRIGAWGQELGQQPPLSADQRDAARSAAGELDHYKSYACTHPPLALAGSPRLTSQELPLSTPGHPPASAQPWVEQLKCESFTSQAAALSLARHTAQGGQVNASIMERCLSV